MNHHLQKIIPPLLKRLDNYLLINYPGIWATRIHYLLSGAAVLLLLGTLIAWAQVDVKDFSSPEFHLSLMIIPVMIVLVVWTISVSRYRIESHFGKISGLQKLIRELIFILSMTILASIPFAYGYMVAGFNATRIADKDLAKDINSLNIVFANLRFPQTEYNPYPEWTPIPLYENGNLEYLTGPELYNEWESADSTSRTAMVNHALQAMNRYVGGYRIQEKVNPATIFTSVTFEKVKWPVNRVSEVKRSFHDMQLIGMDIYKVFFVISFFSIASLLLFFLFIQMGWKGFSLTVILAVLSSIAGVVLIDMVGMFLDFNLDLLTNMLLSVVWIFFIWFSYFGPNSKKWDYIKKLGLALGAGFTPLVFSLWMQFPFTSSSGPLVPYWELIFISFILTYILWHILFYPRFKMLEAAPKQD